MSEAGSAEGAVAATLLSEGSHQKGYNKKGYNMLSAVSGRNTVLVPVPKEPSAKDHPSSPLFRCCGGGQDDIDDGTEENDDRLEEDTKGILSVRTGRVASTTPADDRPASQAMILVMLCMFQGYAAMVGPLQQKFKAELNIGQVGDRAEAFTQAAVFVHYGKFVARLGHNLFLGCFTTMQRVYISMVIMLVGTAIPPLLVFQLGSTWVGWVFVSYGLSGIGLGIFECTFLSVITPLGKRTKAWAIMGAPLGFGMVCVLGQLLFSLQMPVEYLYWYIVACIPAGMVIFHNLAPSRQEQAAGELKRASLWSSTAEWHRWLPEMLAFMVAKVVVNFVMENVTPVNFYIYNADQVPLLGPDSASPLIDRDVFFALVSVFIISGDTISRRVHHLLSLETYSANVFLLLAAVACSFGGFGCEILGIAVVTFPAVFLAFWGNGLVYGLSARYIDRFTPTEHNLAAYSLWCFLGDAGAIAGGSLVDVVRARVCGSQVYAFECRTTN